MGFVPSFDFAEPLAAPAFWIGVAALALAAMMLLSMPLGWLWLKVKQKRRQRVLNRWRHLLMASLYQQPASLPHLSHLDVPDFLELWNHLYQSLGLEARDSLSQVAVLLRMPATISPMLRGKRVRPRLMAVLTAGSLRLAATWDALSELLGHESAALSLAAARALVRIDAARALPLLMPHIVKRDDWAPQRVEDVLSAAGEGNAAEPLLQAIQGARPEKARQLLRYLAGVSPAAAAPLIGKLLANTQDDILLVTCLQLVNSPGDIETVRALTRHSTWYVRVHAATALGRLATHEDEAILAGMLGDSQWWVRYRAAGALSQLPWLDVNGLRHIKDTQTDRYARDMMHQVMAEQELRAAGAERHGG